MGENELEKNLKIVKNLKQELDKAMVDIDQYEINTPTYNEKISTRDNLAITLNYYQNSAIIEQNKEILRSLNNLNRSLK
jgi:hypothetical protein